MHHKSKFILENFEKLRVLETSNRRKLYLTALKQDAKST